jgi:hypothetical protein
VKAGEWPSALTAAKSRLFAGISLHNPALHALLAMQKVVGSNPISRSRKGLRLQVFFVLAVA